MMRLIILSLLLATSARAADPIEPKIVFAIDPITDGTLITAGVGLSIFSELVIRTGELRPQTPGDPDRLLAIDRHFATHDTSRQAGTIISNGGAGLVALYALADITRTGWNAGARTALVDATLYLETATLSTALVNITKLAVRRPRPQAYLDAKDAGLADDTDSALSFYSGHTSLTASLTATATYLAFARHPESNLGWWVLGTGTLLTTTVAVGRVRSRDHFPTDVLAGYFIGTAIGVLVPHVHRPVNTRPLWVSVGPNGKGLSLGGNF